MGNLGVNEEYYHGNLTLPHLFAKAGEFFDTIRKSSVKAHIWNTLVPEISNNLGRLPYYSTRGMSQILQSCLQRDTPTQYEKLCLRLLTLHTADSDVLFI
jgi:hypothetical protein